MAPRALAEKTPTWTAAARRPPLEAPIRELIRRLGREHPRWGYLRIRGELLNLGIDVSATTIATVLRRCGLGPAPRRIGPTWTQFLRLQVLGILRNGPRFDGHDDWLEDFTRCPASPAIEREVPAPLGDNGTGMGEDDKAVSVILRLVRWSERCLATVAARSLAAPKARLPPQPPPPPSRDDGHLLAA